MIIKSFFRKKSTKIYLAILILLFTTLFIINSLIKDLITINNENFKQTALLYIENSSDLKQSLAKNKYLENITRIETFYYDNNSYFDELELINYDLNSIIVYQDEKNILNKYEVIIGLSELDYVNKKEFLNDIKGKNMTFKYQNSKIELIIKDIIDTNRTNNIIISQDLFNDLIKNDNYIYLANVTNENKVESLVKEYKNKANNVIVLDNMNSQDALKREEISNLLSHFTIINYIFIILFIIVVFIVNYNLICDLNINRLIEKRLGFNRHQISKNILKRLALLYIIAILSSYILKIIIIKFLI